MAALAETRDIGSHRQLPSAIRRLCCIGDSLTYGQGVAPRQTLAAHLARFVNMSFPAHMIWVDNLGQSSGNIWHSWVPFKRLAQRVNFDAAVFSICQNDAQLFESNSVRYGNDPAQTWLTGGKLTPIVKRTLEEVVKDAQQLDTRVILDFYTLWERDAPLITALMQECRQLGLPFIDLLDFLKNESGMTAAEFIASPFDGHPSSAGHHAAARRIAEELRESWAPPMPEEGSLSERLIRACDEAVQLGWPEDHILQWARVVLEAKEVVARRRRSRPETAALFGDLAATRAEIERRYAIWCGAIAARVSDRLLYQRRDEVEVVLERAYATIRNLDELAFALEHLMDGETGSELWALIERAGYYNQQNRLLPLPAKLKGQFLATAQDARNIPASPVPQIDQYVRLRSDLQHSLRRLAAQLPDRLDEATMPVGRRGLWQVARYLVDAALSYFREVEGMIAQTIVSPPAALAFFTSVEVRVARDKSRPKRGGVFSLTVEADYIEPRRERRRCSLWAGADQDDYLYSFEIPLLLLGDLRIGVPEWDDVHRRFLDGELSVARVVVTNMPGESERTARRLVWTPGPNDEPRNWISLSQLVVP